MGVLVVVVLVFSMLHIVPAGTVLVPVTLGDAQTAETQGLHVTLPWPLTRVTSMSVRIQNYTMAAANIPGTDKPVIVLGSDGASGTVDATVLYRLNPHRASDVYTNIGVNFGTVLVQPTARKCIRDNFANYPMVHGGHHGVQGLGPADLRLHQPHDRAPGHRPGRVPAAPGRAQQLAVRRHQRQGGGPAERPGPAVQQGRRGRGSRPTSPGSTPRPSPTRSSSWPAAGSSKTVTQNGVQVQVVTPNPAGVCQAPRSRRTS